MSAARKEVEIKLPFDTPERARTELERIGAVLDAPRHFEDNTLFDVPPGVLRSRGELLRLRRVGERAILTMKRPVPGEHVHKVREELECEVGDGAVLEAVVDALGALPVYRYQKYRTAYRLGELQALLDETPIGCFVELEGEPERIDAVARELGFGRDAYVRDSYIALHERSAAQLGRRRGDMLMPRDDAGGGAAR